MLSDRCFWLVVKQFFCKYKLEIPGKYQQVFRGHKALRGVSSDMEKRL